MAQKNPQDNFSEPLDYQSLTGEKESPPDKAWDSFSDPEADPVENEINDDDGSTPQSDQASSGDGKKTETSSEEPKIGEPVGQADTNPEKNNPQGAGKEKTEQGHAEKHGSKQQPKPKAEKPPAPKKPGGVSSLLKKPPPIPPWLAGACGVIIVIIILIAVLILTLFAVGMVGEDDNTEEATTTTGLAGVVEIAQKEAGIPSGDAVCGTGCEENDGPPMKYKEYGGCPNPCDPWCAAFVSWVFNEAGYTFVKTCYVWSLYLNDKFTHYPMTDKNSAGWPPQPGDILIRDCHEGGGHTGILVKYDAKKDLITYVDGNGGTCVKQATVPRIVYGVPYWCHYVRMNAVNQ